MILNVPYNWDLQLIEKVTDYKQNIGSFYAALSVSICGSIRHRDAVPAFTSLDEAKNHVEAIHKFGAEFHYLANGFCLSNRELSLQKELHEFFSKIQDIGTDYVVIANPFLIDFVHHHFPDLKIKISTGLTIDSAENAKYFLDRADAFVVSDILNRNFSELKKLVALGKDIEVMLNNTCLLHCPIRSYHGCFSGHNSQTDVPYTERFDEFPTVWCSTERSKDFTEIIKSPWIRPEDIKEYEKIGIKHFKISGREKKTDWITERVRIYSQRSHEGNSTDFLHTILYGYPKFSPPLFIDNKKLDGFINYFTEEKCNFNCPECDHCSQYTQKALQISDIENYRSYITQIKERLYKCK